MKMLFLFKSAILSYISFIHGGFYFLYYKFKLIFFTFSWLHLQNRYDIDSTYKTICMDRFAEWSHFIYLLYVSMNITKYNTGFFYAHPFNTEEIFKEKLF